MSRAVRLVDVFGRAAFGGNPLAVVDGGDDLDAAGMLRITRWLNLSETTFLCRPTDAAADYRVRIFTPDRELPFAGHPTLGTCHAWLEAGGTPRDPARIVQQCGAGLVALRRAGTRLAFAAPPLVRAGPLDAAALGEVTRVLRIGRDEIVAAEWIDNGPGWIGVRLASRAAVLAIDPLRAPGQRTEIGVFAVDPDGDSDVEVRALFTDAAGTLIEDPVTGSLNASIAQWLFANGAMTRDYVAAQGAALGRCGRVHLSRDGGGEVWVAGSAETLIEGIGRF